MSRTTAIRFPIHDTICRMPYGTDLRSRIRMKAIFSNRHGGRTFPFVFPFFFGHREAIGSPIDIRLSMRIHSRCVLFDIARDLHDRPYAREWSSKSQIIVAFLRHCTRSSLRTKSELTLFFIRRSVIGRDSGRVNGNCNGNSFFLTRKNSFDFLGKSVAPKL